VLRQQKDVKRVQELVHQMEQKVPELVKCPHPHLIMTFQGQFQPIKAFQEDHRHPMKTLWTLMVFIYYLLYSVSTTILDDYLRAFQLV
jgi:hypothetical protein